MKEKTHVDDIDRSIYDFRFEDKDAYKVSEGLTEDIVLKISEDKTDPEYALSSPDATTGARPGFSYGEFKFGRDKTSTEYALSSPAAQKGQKRPDFNDGEFKYGKDKTSPEYALSSPAATGGSRPNYNDGKFAFGGKKPTYARASAKDGERAEQVLWPGYSGPKGQTPPTTRAMMAAYLAGK